MSNASNTSLDLNSGVYPIAPTPFLENGDIDLEGQRRVLDCMVDQKVDGICILANYSEQFMLSDAERSLLLKICTEHVAGRVPIIVTCSHYSTLLAVERARTAEQAGAAMIMVMPPYHGALLRADSQGVYEHFAELDANVSIPIMVQDAPLSGVDLSIELLCRMARELTNVSHFKIEMPSTANKLRNLINAGGEHIKGPFDGEESITLMADLDAGATGTMPSALLPDLIGPVVRSYLAGDRATANNAYNRILPLINFENRQCNLRATKTVMMEGGVIQSDTVRHPFTPMPAPTRDGLMKIVNELMPLAASWGK